MFRGRRFEDELSAELESHLQMHIEDNLRSGMTKEQARRRALVALGGLEQARQAYRERKGLPWLETLCQDIGFGLRMLRKHSGFTTVSVLTLALGIGANTAIFSATKAVLMAPLPYQDPSRIVAVWTANPASGGQPLPSTAIVIIFRP
jgi:putative ABC transport system permease protein